MSDWSSRPRQLPWAGRRKGTHRWCDSCQAMHRTHRAVGGEEVCPVVAATRQINRDRLYAAPFIKPSKPGQTRVNVAPLGRG